MTDEPEVYWPPEPPGIDTSAEADLKRLLAAIEKLEPWVRPPVVRSVAGLHRGSERLLVVKSHRWDTFQRKIHHIKKRAAER